MPNKFFEELDAPWSGAAIFLDIDGTLRPDDRDTKISPGVLKKVEELKARNAVYMVSNREGAKKPGRSAAGGKDLENKKIIVIGDKFLTDGIFAKNIGADFIKVKRKISGKESFFIKLTYAVDDFFSKILWKQKNI